MTITKGLFSSNTDEWATPQDLFDKLNRTFHFTLDVCATPQNAKCKKFYTKEQDGLKQDWGGCYLVQSTLWQRNWQMGPKMCRTQRSGGYVDPSSHRHKMVARICSTKSDSKCSFHQGQIKIWKCEEFSTVSKCCCYIFQHRIRKMGRSELK